MPKHKPNTYTKLNACVSKYGDNVFAIANNKLFCKLCNIEILGCKNFNVDRHIHSDKHRKGLEKTKVQNLQQEHSGSYNTVHDFNTDLCNAFISSNIPLFKLKNNTLRTFLQKYTGRQIPDESTLRKLYVKQIYDKNIEEIRNEPENERVWISIDETTDAVGRHIASVIVGALKAETPGRPYLVTCEPLNKVNFSTVCELFESALKLLWPSGIKHDNVLLFITDAGTYMVKAAKSLKNKYRKMIHVTCLAHACHRVAEEVRSHFPIVDKLIANMKKVFVKSPGRVSEFKKECPDVPLPPCPVLTRWGTWLKSCNYYHLNLDSVKKGFSCLIPRTRVQLEFVRNY